MNKTLFAVALAMGFGSAAQAETSVTLYGVIDTGVGYQRVKGTVNGKSFTETQTGVTSGVQAGNRWGLKGSEDLGNGLQAIFDLENGFDSSVGTASQSGRLFGRQATIGLQDKNWGRLEFGRQFEISSPMISAIDPFSGAWGQARVGTAFSSAAKTRWDNMIQYHTPNFSGFRFGAGYSFNINGSQSYEIDGAPNANATGITTGLQYVSGPLRIALTWDQIKTGTPAAGAGASPDTNISEWILGGSYDFDIVKVSLVYGQTRDGWMTAWGYTSGNATSVNLPTFYGARGLRVNSYMAGLQAPVGNGAVLASWVMADPRNGADGAGNSFNRDLSKQNSFNLGYVYQLSKRTNVYVLGSYAQNVSFYNGVTSTYASVGIRHNF